MLLRTATDDRLGSEKWDLGPTGVLLKQEGPWTYGILANQIWSVAGSDRRPDISSTYLQPFLSYITKTHTTYQINTESTYNWKNSRGAGKARGDREEDPGQGFRPPAG